MYHSNRKETEIHICGDLGKGKAREDITEAYSHLETRGYKISFIGKGFIQQ